MTVSVTGSPFQVQAWRSGSIFELPALERLGVGFLWGLGWSSRREAAQNRLHALDQKALGERFADEIVGAHLEAEQLVDLLVLRGQEDHRQVRSSGAGGAAAPCRPCAAS